VELLALTTWEPGDIARALILIWEKTKIAFLVMALLIGWAMWCKRYKPK
jgi:hypothetical protein